MARENVADNVVWNFKLLTGGEKPSIPSKFMKFGVNDYGSDGLAFTDEFMQAVKSDKPPMLELYGKNVKVFFASAFKEYLKKVKFKIDSEPEVVKEAEGEYNFRAEHIFEGLEKDSEHTITATVVPTSENYKETEYKFKVKILSELEVPKDTYEFSIDGTERPNGYKATLERDFATLEFRVYGELVETVKMGKEGELNNVNMTPFPTTSGKKVYTCHYNIDLSIDNDENWIIEVTPKEQDKYPIVKCKYILKGRVKTDENNASFVLNNVGKPNVTPKVTRRDGINNTGVDDYGAISVDFEAYTMAKGSTVKAIRIHTFKDTDMPGETAITLTRDGNSRKVTGKVDAYTDRPTKVKVWVIAKDGATQDETNGVYKVVLNPVPLWWSYRNIKTTDKAKPAYAEIRISKVKVKKDGKIYVFFAPFKEYYGFNVALDATSEGQTELEKLGNFGYTQELFRTSLNVKDMKVGDTKEVWCKLVHTKNGIEGLTYTVKVLMEN